MNKNIYKVAFNWVAPVVVVIIIITGGFIEGLFVALAYIIYRFVDEQDKIYSYYGKRKYLKGKLKKAVLLYEKAFNTKKAEAKVCISYCYSLILSKQLQKASEILAITKQRKDIKEIEPQIIICENLLLWKNENRLIKAIMDLEKIQEQLKTTSYYGILGKMLIENGNLEKAQKFNEDAYRYNNNNEHILENLLRIYCLTEKYEKAIKVVPKLMKLKPFTKDAYYYSAIAYEKNDNKAKAQKMYNKMEKYEASILTSIKEGNN